MNKDDTVYSVLLGHLILDELERKLKAGTKPTSDSTIYDKYSFEFTYRHWPALRLGKN